jgi:hypothetical protein
VRNTYAPAVLVEVCFCDNITDANLYKKLGPDRIGRAIASGILGKDISEPKVETQKAKKIKAKETTPIYEITGAMRGGAIEEIVDETDEFYVLSGKRFVRKGAVDVL